MKFPYIKGTVTTGVSVDLMTVMPIGMAYVATTAVTTPTTYA
jgi:hypothetical protein